MNRERLVDEVLMLMPTLMRAIGGPDPAEMAELASRGVPTEVRVSPGHVQIMIALTRGPHSVGQLAEVLGVSPPAATRLVDRLVEHGMVERRHDLIDPRVVLVDYVPAMRDVARRLMEVRRHTVPRGQLLPARRGVVIASHRRAALGDRPRRDRGCAAPFRESPARRPRGGEYQLSVGGEDDFSPDTPLRAANQAQAFITAKVGADVSKILERVDEEGRDLYGNDFQVEVLSQGPPTGGIEVLITGGSERELREASGLVTEELSEKKGVANVESDLSDLSPEVEVALDADRAAESGLSPAQIPASLGALLGGGAQLAIGETPVSVGLPEGSVDSIEDVRNLPVGSGATVGDVAEVREAEAPAFVSRVDGDRAVTVTGTITSEDTGSVSSEVRTSLSELDLPGTSRPRSGVSLRISKRASGT